MEGQTNKDASRKTIDHSTDSLTGLVNYDVFQIILEWESVRSRRYGTSFTLALLDIDSFSLYNKQKGTSQGDDVLRKVARIIRKTIRRCDIAARYSGNVFAVILTKYPAEPSHTAVERIRAEVEAFTRGEVTLSAGLTTCPQDAAYGNLLIDKAQEALTVAKTGGGNKIYFLKGEGQPAIIKKTRILLVGNAEQIKDTETLIETSDPNCEIIRASGGDEALSLIDRMKVDLILMDAVMPKPDGYAVCRRLKENEDTRITPVIILTSSDDRKDKIRAIEAGADDFMIAPPDRIELMARTQSLLRESALNRKHASIESVLMSMANAVEAKDVYAQGHSVRVSDMAVTLGKKMNLSEEEIDALRLGGILHDIGKIGVPGEILNRPGRLTPDEFEIVKTHPEASCNICQPLQKTLGPALDVIRHHHEKLDGSGYPDGLQGDDISIIARIAGIVDIFDALIANRAYRRAMSREDAFEILRKEADEGKLDKVIVGHLIDMVGKA
ncbi:MAG: diguanylate cyclase [Deltaproteobacteria bacterium]|nr:diguanylate cyclase [Deltaproteobacteria bacterium]